MSRLPNGLPEKSRLDRPRARDRPKPRRRPRPKEPGETTRRSRSAPAQSNPAVLQQPSHTAHHEGFLFRKLDIETLKKSTNRWVSWVVTTTTTSRRQVRSSGGGGWKCVMILRLLHIEIVLLIQKIIKLFGFQEGYCSMILKNPQLRSHPTLGQSTSCLYKYIGLILN